MQEQQGKQNNGGHNGAQDACQQTHVCHGGKDLRSVVPDHEDPAPVLQELVDHKLFHSVFIPVRVCAGLRAAVGADALQDFEITGVSGFCVQERVVFVIEIDAGVHIQKDIFTVRQTLDIQIQQRVHKVAGINARAHIADALLPLEYGVVHG